MAYRADIEIAVRGAQELKRLQNEVSATSKLVNQLNTYLENIGDGGIVRSINNLRDVVGRAAAAFNDAALGTEEATIAAKKYITATRELNSGLRERAELLKQITEQERKAKLASAGIRETTQYGGPIGPGQASPVALTSQLRGRTEQILAERKGRTELNAVLQNQFEKERQLANSKLDAQAAKVQAALEAQANAAAESANQTQKLADKQQEFTQRTEAAARAARAQTAEFIRQQRLQKDFLRGSQVSNVEFAPGGAGFSGGFTPRQREVANAQAIIKANQQENTLRRETLQLITREELFELKLNKVLERNAAAVAKRTANRRQASEAAGNAIIGGAFPLLFGQGLGAAVGGGAGGALGGALGGSFGFGLSLVGTAIGSAFDTAANSSRDFAKALRGTGDATQSLEGLLGGLNPQTRTFISNLQSSGQTARAAQVAFNELSGVIGKENTKALQDAGNGWDNFGKQVRGTLTLITAEVIKTFKEIERTNPQKGGFSIASFIGQIALQGEKRQQPAAITPEAAQRAAGLQQETDQLRTQATLSTLSAKNNLDLFVYTSQRLAQQERISREAEIEYKFVQGQISAKEKLVLLDQSRLKTQIDLNNIERQRIEELQRRQEEAARKAEEAARKQEQTIKNILGLQIELSQVTLEAADVDINRTTATQGQLAGLKETLSQQQGRLNIEGRILDLQLEQKLLSSDISAQERELLTSVYNQQRANLEIQVQVKAQLLQLDIARLETARSLAALESPRKLQDIRQQRGGQLARTQAQLASPFGGDALAVVNQQFDQLSRRYETLVPLERQLADLQLERFNIASSASTEELTALDQRIAGTSAAIELEKQYLSQLDTTEQALLRQQQIYEKYGFIVDEVSRAFSDSITGIVTGTTTVAEAFSRMFENIGKAFIDMATQMMAQQLFMTVVRAFTGGVTGSGGSEGMFSAGSFGFSPSAGMMTFAEGGFVTGPTRALVGEGGESEYVIPASKMSAAMSRYSRGARGESVIAGTGTATDTQMAAGGSAQPIDVRYTVERINNVDYVTADQFQAGMAQAAQRGAIEGERRAMRTLKTSAATRRSVGV